MEQANNTIIVTTGASTLARPQQLTHANISVVISYFLSESNLSASSKALYTRTLRLFYKWVEETHRDILALELADIQTYKQELGEHGLSDLTISSYLTSLRTFYDWLSSKGLYTNILVGCKTPRRSLKHGFIKQHLTEDKSAELLDHFKEMGLRDYAMINLMLRTGLRTIEVVRADIGDITYKQGVRVLNVWGKGCTGKDDFVVLTDKAYEPIKEYLSQCRKKAKPGEPLFTSSSHRNGGERLTTRSISRICKEGLQAIGLDGREYTAHSLRHTTAVAILKASGNNVADAQHVLRHTTPTTTQIYLESIKEEMRLQHAPEKLLDDAF